MRTTPLLTLRVTVLASAATLIAVFAVLVLVGLRFTAADILWVAVPVVPGVADIVLVPSVGSTVRPLPLTADAAAARRVSLGALRNVVLLRMALAELPALVGLVAAFVADSLVPLAVGTAFSLPLILLFAYPSAAVVNGVQRRLEQGGATSHLWDALTEPG